MHPDPTGEGSARVALACVWVGAIDTTVSEHGVPGVGIWSGTVRREVVRTHGTEIAELAGGCVDADRVIGLLDADGVVDGFPAVFDGGRLLGDVHDFLRDGRHLAVGSLRQYTGDILMLARAVGQEGTGLLGVTADDIRRFRDARRRDVGGERWNRQLAVLTLFYRYHVARQHIPALPLPKWPDAAGRSTLRARVQREPTVRCLTVDQYRSFRDVGLRGDVSGACRSGADGFLKRRAAVFADALVLTGCRREEIARLTVAEIPDRLSAGLLLPIRILGKGAKEREVLMPRELIRRLIEYQLDERANVVAAAQDGLRRAARDGQIVVCRLVIGRRGEPVLTVGGDRRPVTRWTLDELRRMTFADGEQLDPVLMFIRRGGRAVSLNSWNKEFDVASQRCARLLNDDPDRPPRRVTPHMLRHTFAVQFLSAHLKALAGRPRLRSADILEGPVRTLQRLLGHASPASTYRYLSVAERVEGPVFSALDDLVSGLALR